MKEDERKPNLSMSDYSSGLIYKTLTPVNVSYVGKMLFRQVTRCRMPKKNVSTVFFSAK